MTTVKLGDKTYEVPFISGAAMRGIDGVRAVFEKAQEEKLTEEDVETACEWFATLFHSQFTVQELMDGYPVDDLLEDIFTVYIAVERRSTKVLREFPIPPTVKMKTPPKTEKTA